MSRITDKMGEIQTYLKELESFVPRDLGLYRKDILRKAACERFAEKIIEAGTDLAFFIIKLKKFRKPNDDPDAFSILTEEKIIDEPLSRRLQSAKGMKNIIAHQYGKIDDAIVFEAVSKELPRDMKQFLKESGEAVRAKPSP